ncbi:MAG: hypothetical protein FWB72_01145 [Firmicutes bacterium]|nr:hypothetical protein [Bacillota bacterium]
MRKLKVLLLFIFTLSLFIALVACDESDNQGDSYIVDKDAVYKAFREAGWDIRVWRYENVEDHYFLDEMATNLELINGIDNLELLWVVDANNFKQIADIGILQLATISQAIALYEALRESEHATAEGVVISRYGAFVYTGDQAGYTLFKASR